MEKPMEHPGTLINVKNSVAILAMAVGQNQWYHFGVGAPPILEPILVGIGMFTGGTIWILTHGQIGLEPTAGHCLRHASLLPLGQRLCHRPRFRFEFELFRLERGF